MTDKFSCSTVITIRFISLHKVQYLQYLPSSFALFPSPCFVYLCRWKKAFWSANISNTSERDLEQTDFVSNIFFKTACSKRCTPMLTRTKLLAHFLSVFSPLDFEVAGSILKTRIAWWPLLMLLSFTSSMSGSEFIAQRKLAFHVFGSQAWPSMYFPAEFI